VPPGQQEIPGQQGLRAIQDQQERQAAPVQLVLRAAQVLAAEQQGLPGLQDQLEAGVVFVQAQL
jgi:hypothetical protein